MASMKPLKVVSEATRERETFRYDPSLLTNFTFYCDGRLPPKHELRSASDSILTGLAQLGTCQTGTDRAFVSLFDSSHQYVVAEATPSMRIAPDLPNLTCPESLLLCGTAIPRNQGTCDHVLYMKQESNAELPLSLVPNLAEDSYFSSRPYCQFGESGQFYAAVPIRTPRGIDIGAYCVMSTTQPSTWNDQSAQRMRDVSLAITNHLQLKRSKHEARNHARVNRGLGSFIAGKGTLTGWHTAANLEAFVDDDALEGALNAEQQHSEYLEGNQRQGAHISSELQDQEFNKLHQHASPPATNSLPSILKLANLNDNALERIFSKAANIIREAFEVEGTVFLDVAMGSYRRPQASPTEEVPNIDQVLGQACLSSSSDEQPQTPAGQVPDESSCDLLGFSNTDFSSVNDSTLINGSIGDLPQRFLAKLLHRYPDGKIFNFDSVGELQTSDSSGDDDVLKNRPDTALPQTTSEGTRRFPDAAQRKRAGNMYSRSQEGALIHRAFPGARSVAFIPIWDPKRERWMAGGFIYTFTPTRVFSTDSELAFLGAFAKLIAAEVLNLETVKADMAKSDALGALSHELRSPLHGVILSTGLLNDTDLSVFQVNAIHTIETCGRTLLDTIDHLLDYSKVNSFAAKRVNSTTNGREHRKMSRSDLFGKKSLFRHTRLDALVEDVVESVFAGFNFQHMSIRQLSKQNRSSHADNAAHSRLDGVLAMEQLGSNFNDSNDKLSAFKNTAVYLSMDPKCHWVFYVQPGALRRIVMNLLGNSLKYTASGIIHVSLTQQSARRSSNERLVRLTVHDTGKGMGEDYLRHKLFKPFSQEDEFTPGIGLGLSLVKKMTTQLHGQISVESKLGVGTTIVVTLPLEQTSRRLLGTHGLTDRDRVFKEQVKDLTNLRVRLRGFGPEWSKDGRTLVEDVCCRWLHLELVSGQDKIPDLILWSEDALPSSMDDVAQLAKIPNVVVCRDALAAYRLLTRHENLGQDGIFECMSQPLGPRALARALLRAYERWVGLPQLVMAVLPRPASSPVRVVDPARSEAEMKPADSRPEANIMANSSNRKVRKLLLVDDNSINLKVLSAYMRKLGQTYAVATNGKEAVDAYTSDPGMFAGILMDISMPVMDGLEATRQIRAHERRAQTAPVAIIVLTGLASDRIRNEAFESGVTVFLTRPVGLILLRETLDAQGLLPREKMVRSGS
ncbi:hypothetical protein NXS19_002660 [Fusarium pseudograminearum]|nr:hypothetical protein NXS19_002660 [Fusarium pseudograminearum]